MTISELIEELKKENPARIVVCQSDAEGNNYSPLSHIRTGAYLAVTTWSGEVGLEPPLTKQDIKDGCSQEDVIEEGEPALVLVPIN